jgi:general secretion pathway protein G
MSTDVIRRARGWSLARLAARRRAGGAAGFTLIELLIVIALITILATMGIVQYRNSIQSTREAILKTDLFRMRDAIDQYYADKTKYPASLDALVTDGYMRKIPEDPITKSADTWQTVPAEPDPGNPSSDPGIYNVKSGAEGTALDGTAYSEF